MDIKQTLPTGSKLHMSGSGSFGKKLSQATVYSKFKNLRDNKESIVKAVGSYASAIRRGNFGRLKQRGFIGKVKQMEKQAGRSLTLDDKRDLKEISKYLGSEPTAEQPSHQPTVDTEERLQQKLAAREAVKSGVRPNRLVTKINRDPNNQLPGETHAFSPYNRLHKGENKRFISISQIKPRTGTPETDSEPKEHGTGLSSDPRVHSDPGRLANEHLGLGFSRQADAPDRDEPSASPPISLVS